MKIILDKPLKLYEKYRATIPRHELEEAYYLALTNPYKFEKAFKINHVHDVNIRGVNYYMPRGEKPYDLCIEFYSKSTRTWRVIGKLFD